MQQDNKSPAEMILFVEELKRQWMTTIDAMLDPLMMVSSDYKILKVNRAMANFAESDVKTIIGKTCYKMLAGADSPCSGCLMHDSVKNRTPHRFNLNQIKGSFDFEVTSQPIVSSNERLEGIVHVYRDRTEANALQKKLLQSEKLASIGLLAGGIAHEINNPLGGILIFSQMLLREMPTDSPYYEDVKEIENAALRCKSIVERVLDFARAQPDMSKKKWKRVKITESVKDALKFASVHANAKKIEISENWLDDQAIVRADKNSIIQVFLNLLQNAFQAMPQGGQLHLRSKKEFRDGLPWGIWEIEDSGDGIAKEDLKKIFDPFFTTKEPGEGTGLGLSICYGICQEIGGYIDVSSQRRQGTCFRVHLPLAKD